MEVAEKIWLVTFMHYDLGFFDHETGRERALESAATRDTPGDTPLRRRESLSRAPF